MDAPPNLTHIAPRREPPLETTAAPPRDTSLPSAAASDNTALADQGSGSQVNSDATSFTVDAQRRIGKYHLLSELGAGGMGVVYKAWDNDLKRIVALKMIRAGQFADSGEVSRFLREREALARIKHPRIVPIHDAGQEGGQPYFVLEYLAGGSFRDHMKELQADRRAGVAVLETMARAVQAVHDADMLHRDIKPSNILFNEEGQPFLTDFGLIKLLDDSSTELTRTNQRVGTPSYMSPEQTGLSTDSIGPGTDVWSLGVILYELVNGRRPFHSDDYADLCQKILSDTPAPPSSTDATAPDAGLDRIILKCLAKSPRERYASANDLADELGRWLRGEKLLTRRESLARRCRRLVRRRPLAAVAIALALGGLITWLTAALLHDPERGLRNLEKQLASGEAVVLFVEQKWPLHIVDRLDPNGKATRAPDKSLLLQSWEIALWELAPQPHQKAYRLRAKIRHLQSGVQGEAGFYFARHGMKVEDAYASYFFKFTFNDVNDERERAHLHNPEFKGIENEPLRNRAAVHSLVHVPRGGTDWWGNQRSVTNSPPFAATGLKADKWRDLVVEIYPDRFTGSFQGWPLPPADPQRTVDLVNQDLNRIRAEGHDLSFLGDFTPEYHPEGSLGIYLRQGSAALRDVVFEPLPLPKE